MIPNMGSESALLNQSLYPNVDHTTIADINSEESGMMDLFRRYAEVHGYVSGVVCIFGVISNILNIIVLTRKHMISPTNCILTALATADMLTMLTYLIYAIYFYIATEPLFTYPHTKQWMYFILVHNLFIITCHNMAMWLTVTLAVFRYIFVCHHVVANQLCSLERAIVAIIIVMIATIVACVPNYFLYKIYPITNTTYWIGMSDIAESYEVFQVITFWIYGVVIKVAPCILLTILSTMIILAMHQATQRRQRLLQQTKRGHEHESAEHNRTTMMLVAVVLCFVITEFPQGILAMISGLNDNFFKNVYSNLGDIMDLLVLLNSAINFILYCIMSQQFRETFKSLFVCRYCPQLVRKINGTPNGLTYSTVKTEVTQV